MARISPRVAGFRYWTLGGSGCLYDDLRARRSRGQARKLCAEDPPRHGAVSEKSWEEMSRLSRMLCFTALPLLIPRKDRKEIPIVWGSCYGDDPLSHWFQSEALPVPSGGVDFTEPDFTPPLQQLLIHSPAQILAQQLDSEAPVETLSAGAATGIAALLRGLDWLSREDVPAVLVAAGDGLSIDIQDLWSPGDEPRFLGEGVACILLARDSSGPKVRVSLDLAPLEGHLTLARQTRLPGEDPLWKIPGAQPPEQIFGLYPSMGLMACAALLEGRGGSVVDQDMGTVFTARVREG